MNQPDLFNDDDTPPQLEKPLVYACSGCSNVAQLANDLAVVLDREGHAEMSCIAGIGGQVKSMVRTAQRAMKSGRAILAIDGCSLGCVRQCLQHIAVVPTWHIEVTAHGFTKRAHSDTSLSDAYQLLQHIQCDLLSQVAPPFDAAEFLH